ncbi:MAG: 50S ribosomal protein L10 [Candidatus Gracilibacteria bacterium]|nr:50S ribosomal protein L10 [Candidatus Gracilibacteria bacterium]
MKKDFFIKLIIIKMALTRTKKKEVLSSLIEKLKVANSVGFTTNKALTVEEVTNLRVNLREVNAEFHLAKKTLIKIAFKEVYNVEIDDSLLPNQIALVLSNEDAVAGLGKVNDFMKKGQPGEEKMSWTGSYFEGNIMDAAATIEIAGMPSRDTLLSRMVGSLMSPLSGMARFLDAAATEVEAQGKENLSQIEVKKEEEKTEA